MELGSSMDGLSMAEDHLSSMLNKNTTRMNGMDGVTKRKVTNPTLSLWAIYIGILE